MAQLTRKEKQNLRDKIEELKGYVARQEMHNLEISESTHMVGGTKQVSLNFTFHVDEETTGSTEEAPKQMTIDEYLKYITGQGE